MSTAVTCFCGWCGRPVNGGGFDGVLINGAWFHRDCARAPAKYREPLPLSEDDIRRIVREEIAKSQEPQWKSA